MGIITNITTAIGSYKNHGPATRLAKKMGLRASDRGSRSEHVDLHMHSYYSDGFFSPTQLATIADYLELKVVAPTDHDTNAGVQEMQEACAQFGIRVIPAIELKTTGDIEAHVLGYHMTFSNPELLRRLNDIHEAKMENIKRSLGNLKKSGLELSEADIKKIFPQGARSTAHLAEILRLNNHVTTFRQGLGLLFGLHIEHEPKIEVPYMTLKESIKLIHVDGGIPIWAHPTRNARRREKLLRHFISEGLFGPEGLMGFEFVHGRDVPNGPIELIPMIDTLREEHGIHPILTNGSDYHDGRREKFGGVSLPWEVGRVRDLDQLDEAKKDKTSILIN